MSDRAKQAGEAAIEALDRALACKPKRDGKAFAEVTKHLCEMRDLMIADARATLDGLPGAVDRLERLNGIISATLAGHFPLGNAPWPEIEQARHALEGMVTQA